MTELIVLDIIDALAENDLGRLRILVERYFLLERLVYQTRANEPMLASDATLLHGDLRSQADLTAMITRARLCAALKHQLLWNEVVDGPEYFVLLKALSRGRVLARDERRRRDEILRHRLVERLIEMRIAFGIDAPGRPGSATGPDPLRGAERWLEDADEERGSRTSGLLRDASTIPTVADIDRAIEMLARAESSIRGDFEGRTARVITAGGQDDPTLWRGSWIELASLVALRTSELHRDLSPCVLVAAELAINAHREQHGAEPATWTDLDERLRRLVPPDFWADDGLVRYRRVFPATPEHRGGYLLYSVGGDGIDDGGVRPPPKRPEPDVESQRWLFDDVFKYPSDDSVRARADEVIYWPPYLDRDDER